PEHRPYDAAMVAKVLEEVEQKVADLRSAGVDAATARATDRGAKRPADETDREAARTLRGAVAKKKFRKKAAPLAERQWFRASMLLAGLLAIAGALMWFTRPASEGDLYRRAKVWVEAKDVDRAIEATDRYLSRFGGQAAGAHTDEVAAWNRTFWVQKREQQLHNRFTSKLNLSPEDDGQKLAYQALKHENAGELHDAEQAWQELEKEYKDAQVPEPAVYAWVARKKLDDLASLPARERTLTTALEQEHALLLPDHKTELDATGRMCLEASRFEAFGDLTAARDRWGRVVDDHGKDKDLANRGWVILAADHARRLRAMISTPKDKEKEERLGLLQRKFDEAATVPIGASPSDLHRAVSIYRDLRDLYANDPDPAVSAFAHRARRRLQELKRH
ncbi:MAG TPA: hypothetical protein VGF55_16345, partial [Gemmataceae bacterium]